MEKRTASGGVIVSACIPVFDRILSNHTSFVLDSGGLEEDENKRWAMCQHHGNFLLAIWKHVRMSEDTSESMEVHSQLCESLRFDVVYKVAYFIPDKLLALLKYCNNEACFLFPIVPS